MKYLLTIIFLMSSSLVFADGSAKLRNYYNNLNIIAECAVIMSQNFNNDGSYNMQRHQFLQFQTQARKALGTYMVEKGSEFKNAMDSVNKFNLNVLKESKLKWDNGSDNERKQFVEHCLNLHRSINK